MRPLTAVESFELNVQQGSTTLLLTALKSVSL